jgi:hypothetical protein
LSGEAGIGKTSLCSVFAASRDAEMVLYGRCDEELSITRLGLRGLTGTEVLDLLESIAGHEMGRAGLALRDLLRAETGGQPVLRHRDPPPSRRHRSCRPASGGPLDRPVPPPG